MQRRLFLVVASALWITPLVVPGARAQSEPSSISICDDPAYRGTADYNHYCSAAPASGGGASGGGGLTGEQQMGMAIGQVGAQMVGQGIHQLLYGDPAARAKAQAEAAARQQAQDEKLEASRRRLLTGDGGLGIKRIDAGGSAPTLANAQETPPAYAASPRPPAPSPPPVPQPPPGGRNSDEGYVRGQKDAADCLPQNAAGFCAGSAPKKAAACIASYKRGYAIGEPAATATLRAAYDEGVAAKTSGVPFSTFSHPAQGTCGVRQSNVYTAGYYGWPFTTIGR